MVTIREAGADELAYIVKTHTRAVRQTAGRGLPRFYLPYSRMFLDILARSRCLVAAASDDYVVGFAVSEPSRAILHSVYVREPHRHRGTGSALFRAAMAGAPGDTVFCTHYIRKPPHLQNVKYSDRPRIQFNPYLIALGADYDPTEKDE